MRQSTDASRPVTASVIEEVEAGANRPVSLSSIVSILRAISVRIEELLDRRDTAPSERERITFDESRKVVMLDGSPHALRTPEQMQFMRILHAHAPGWVERSMFAEANCLVGNFSRLVSRLPPALKEHIEAKPGTGFRLLIR